MKTTLCILLLSASVVLAAPKDRYWLVAQESHANDPVAHTLDASFCLEVASAAAASSLTNTISAKMKWNKTNCTLVKQDKDGKKTETPLSTASSVASKGAGKSDPASEVFIYLEIREPQISPFSVPDPANLEKTMAATGILCTNAVDYAVQRAVWEPYFTGRVYSVVLHWHEHGLPGETRPCELFTIRETNGLEHATEVTKAFKKE